MCTLEKYNISPLCMLSTLMPQILPLLTLMLVCRWCEESTPRVLDPHLDSKCILKRELTVLVSLA